MSILIPLTNSETTVIIDEKYEKNVLKYKWYFSKHRTNIISTRNKLNLARFIMELEGIPVKKKYVIHRNKNIYDCRVKNLAVIHSVTYINRKKRKDNLHGFIGVAKRRNKWEARISFEHDARYLGIFSNKRDAAIAYNNALKKLPIPEEIKVYNKIL